MELFTSAHSRQSELPRMPLHACVFHSLCRRPSARSRIVPQRPSARSRIVLAKRPSARSRIVLPQASICEVADSACGLTHCDCQIHAALIVGSLLIIFFACRRLPSLGQQMSQEEMSQLEEEKVEISIDGAILTTEAELRAWYVETNPLLRSLGLSCPATLYREMQRDLRDFDATVAIIPVSEDMDETLAKRMLDEFMAVGNSKPNQYTVHFRQMCSNGPIYVLTSTSDRHAS